MFDQELLNLSKVELNPWLLSEIAINESYNVLDELTTFIADKYESLESIYKLKRRIEVYGIAESSFENLSTELKEKYNINITKTTEPIIAIEGLGSFFISIINSIKNAISRLIEWLNTDSFFSRWINSNEYYRLRISRLLSGPAKDYGMSNKEAFANSIIYGFSYPVYSSRLNNLISLNRKISTVSNLPDYSVIHIQNTFGKELIELGFTFVDGNLYAPTRVDYIKVPARGMLWTPDKVYNIGFRVLKELLSENLPMTKLGYSLGRSLNAANRKLNEIEVSQSTENLTKLKAHINGIICIRRICEEARKSSGSLARQWVQMVELFRFDK